MKNQLTFGAIRFTMSDISTSFVFLSINPGEKNNSLTIFIHMAVRKDNNIIVVCIHIDPVEKDKISLLNDSVLLTILSGRCGIPENVL